MHVTTPESASSLSCLGNGRLYDVVRGATVPASRVRLSVVIPSFNTGEYVIAAIQSVLTQTYPNLEIIVVDNSSSDDSVGKILSITDERLTCVCQQNRGLAGSRNTGLLISRGIYVGFLDSDDVWLPEKAERHIARMERNPQLGLTFSHSAYLDQGGTPTGQLLMSRCVKPEARDLIRRNHIGNGSTPILRRACLEESGGFDETIQSCEDWELWVRIAVCTKFKIELIPEVLTGYRVRLGSLSVSYDHFISNGELVVARFRRYVPEFSDADARRAIAQNCRIASRKALANGQLSLSRSLFVKALRLYPALILCDPFAAGLALIHVASLPLSNRMGALVYRAALRLMKCFYSKSVSIPPSSQCATGKESE